METGSKCNIRGECYPFLERPDSSYDKTVPPVSEKRNLDTVITKLGIKGVCSISEDGFMMLYSSDKFYQYEYTLNDEIFCALSRELGRSLPRLVKDLFKLNPNLPAEFFCIRGYYSDIELRMWELHSTVGELLPFVEKYAKPSEDSEINRTISRMKSLPADAPSAPWMSTELSDTIEGPCVIDGRDDSCAEIWTLPPIVTSDTLAKIISKDFIAIGGIVEVCYNNEEIKSIILMSKGYSCSEEGFDYEHCASHIINHEEFKYGYCHPKTVGEFLKGYYEEYYWYKNREDPYSWAKSALERIAEFEPEEIAKLREANDPRVKELENEQCARKDPYPLENSPDEYITEPFCGFHYIYGVPFEIQVAACAIVAKVTPEEMMAKLKKASGL